MDFAGNIEMNKPSSKVLRPPGGGSTDIFGAELPQTPRVVKNHMQSNIFGNDKTDGIKNNGDHPRRAQKTIDSYNRLFGEPERPITPAKNHMKSNIPFGGANEGEQQPPQLTNGNGYHHNGHYNGKSGSVSSASSSVSSSTENLKMNGISKTEGNPVTGEGYKSETFHLNGANDPIKKNRVPPGGYSSGLW